MNTHFNNKISRTPVSEKFVMKRFGTIETDLQAPNQCKDIGHSQYEYTVEITCLNKLNDQGFLIDNKIINNVMKHGLDEMTSCELICIHLGNKLEQTFYENGVDICKMYVALKPIIPGAAFKDYAEFELLRDYEQP